MLNKSKNKTPANHRVEVSHTQHREKVQAFRDLLHQGNVAEAIELKKQESQLSLNRAGFFHLFRDIPHKIGDISKELRKHLVDDVEMVRHLIDEQIEHLRWKEFVRKMET